MHRPTCKQAKDAIRQPQRVKPSSTSLGEAGGQGQAVLLSDATASFHIYV